jgi:hypothetical protein
MQSRKIKIKCVLGYHEQAGVLSGQEVAFPDHILIQNDQDTLAKKKFQD